MKTKILVMLVTLFAATTSAFSQKQPDKALYTLCSKSGDCTMTWDEFKRCNKELTPNDKNLKIVSFTVSVLVVPLTGKDSVYVDYGNTGNAFSKETNDALDKLINEKRIVRNKILIEEVKASKDGKEMKITGMVIKLK